VGSKEPLFNPATAVMPAPIGQYAEEKSNSGAWTKIGVVAVTRDANGYRIERDSGSTERLTFYPGGDRFYVAALTSTPDKQFIYALFRKDGNRFLYYEPRCSDFQFVRLPKALWPVIDGTVCEYDSRRKLVDALLAYASMSEPNKRYVPIER